MSTALIDEILNNYFELERPLTRRLIKQFNLSDNEGKVRNAIRKLKSSKPFTPFLRAYLEKISSNQEFEVISLNDRYYKLFLDENNKSTISIKGQDIIVTNQQVTKPITIVKSKKLLKDLKLEQLDIKENILIIGDLHVPFEHSEYLSFCKSVQEEYKCSKIIFIGDIIDNHYHSFHPTDPDGFSGGEELARAKASIKKWYEAFPEAEVTTGNHDCYDAETEILTSNGWKNGVDLNHSDIVATLNLNSNNIEYQKPTELILKDYDGEMIKFKNRNQIDLLVTPNHRMVYSERDVPIKSPVYKIENAYKLSKGRKTFPISGSNGNSDYNVSDDFLKLVAWIITDGSIHANNRFVIYQSKVDYVIEIEALLNRLNIQYKDTVRYRTTTEIAGTKLKSIPLPSHEFKFKDDLLANLIENKYVFPKWLWLLSERQFHLFLQEFIKGDGAFYKNRSCLIAYGTKEVMSQLQALCLQNRVASTLRSYRVKDWKLNIELDSIKSGIILSEAQSIVEYKGKVWCASVPNTTLVVRRNGNVSIQGNCIISRKAFASGLSQQWIKSISDVLEVPGWKFVDSFKFQDILFVHQAGSGVLASYNKALYERCSVVTGHQHTISSLTYVNQTDFGMIVGCGINYEKYAFNYARGGKKPVILSCGVITKDNVPIIRTMK